VKPFTTIAIALFSLVAALHVLRLIYGWDAPDKSGEFASAPVFLRDTRMNLPISEHVP
jgi:hypothetical protein